MIDCIDLCKRFLIWLAGMMQRAFHGTPLQDHAHPTLLTGKTLVFQAEVAAEFGVNGAIILQKVHEWLVYNERKRKALHYVSGRWWAFNSYKQWQESHFTWLSETTVKREFGKLRKRGVLLAGSFGKRGDRRLWSSIDYDRLRAILTPGLAEGDPHPQPLSHEYRARGESSMKQPSGQIDPMPVQLGLMVGSNWPATTKESPSDSKQVGKSKTTTTAAAVFDPAGVGEESLNEVETPSRTQQAASLQRKEGEESASDDANEVKNDVRNMHEIMQVPGVSEALAAKLVAEYGSEKVQAMALLTCKKARENPVGFLLAGLQEGWETSVVSPYSELNDGWRYVTGKYAEFIKH